MHRVRGVQCGVQAGPGDKMPRQCYGLLRGFKGNQQIQQKNLVLNVLETYLHLSVIVYP